MSVYLKAEGRLAELIELWQRAPRYTGEEQGSKLGALKAIEQEFGLRLIGTIEENGIEFYTAQSVNKSHE